MLACALLVGRRRLPATLATAACLVIVLQGWLGIDDEDLVIPLGDHLRGLLRPGPARRDTIPGVLGLVLLDAAVHVESQWTLPAAQDVLWVGLLTAGPWLFGRLVRSHALANEELAAQGRRWWRSSASSPNERWRTSAGGSPASCTTSSPTRSA